MSLCYLLSTMPEAPAVSTTLKTLIAPGVAAVRRFWKPFVLLQSAAFLLVLGYYTSNRVKLACDQLSHVKQQGGLLFTAIAAAFAGGLLPEFAKALVLGDRAITQARIRNTGFAIAAFAFSGVIIDFIYRGMALLFGSDTRFTTVIKKVLFDQYVTTPFYGAPYWVLVYVIRGNRYNVLKSLRPISPRWYVSSVIPLLIPSWSFWLPMTLLIFSLPTPLQFCMFCFASAAWSLVMVFVATKEAEKSGLRIES